MEFMRSVMIDDFAIITFRDDIGLIAFAVDAFKGN